MNYSVYILFSPSSNKYYIGQTQNIVQRLDQHNSSDKYTFTSKYRPWILLVTLVVARRSEAMRIEKYLKKKNRKFILRVINEVNLQKYIIEKFSSAG